MFDEGAARKEIETRLLGAEDVGDAMRLKAAARWNQTEGDWRRLLRLNPGGCFAATAGGRLLATATTTPYGRELAWVGMVLVDPDFRRRGIATKLVLEAMAHLGARGVAAVKLDATPEGAPVYEALGFEAESRIERWTGEARARGGAVGGVGELADISAVFESDRLAFGADRSELLRALFEDACVAPLVSVGSGGLVRGYAIAREGTEAAYVGPLVASDAATASALLDGVLARLAGRRVYVDLNTTFGGGAGELSARGFVRQRELIRMRYGAGGEAGTSGRVFAIAGPEYG